MKPFLVLTLLLLECTKTLQMGSQVTLVEPDEKEGAKTKLAENSNPSVETINSTKPSTSKKSTLFSKFASKTSSLRRLTRKESQASTESAVGSSENAILNQEIKQLKEMIASSDSVPYDDDYDADFEGLTIYKDLTLKINLGKLTLKSVITILHYLASCISEINEPKRFHFDENVKVKKRMVDAVTQRELIYINYAKGKSFDMQTINEALEADTKLNSKTVRGKVIWDNEREILLASIINKNSEVFQWTEYKYISSTNCELQNSFLKACTSVLEWDNGGISALPPGYKLTLKKLLMLHEYRDNITITYLTDKSNIELLAERFKKCADPYRIYLNRCYKMHDNQAMVDKDKIDDENSKHKLMPSLYSTVDNETLLPAENHQIWRVDTWAAGSVLRAVLDDLSKLEYSEKSEVAVECEMISNVLKAVILTQSEMSEPYCQLAFSWTEQEINNDLAKLTRKIYNTSNRVTELIQKLKDSREVLLNNKNRSWLDDDYYNFIVNWKMLNHLKNYTDLILVKESRDAIEEIMMEDNIGEQLRSILSELKPFVNYGMLSYVNQFKQNHNAIQLWAVNARAILICIAEFGRTSQDADKVTSLFKLLVRFTVVLDSPLHITFNTQINDYYKGLNDDLKEAMSKVLQGSSGDKIIDGLNHFMKTLKRDPDREECDLLNVKCKLLRFKSDAYSNNCNSLEIDCVKKMKQVKKDV